MVLSLAAPGYPGPIAPVRSWDSATTIIGAPYVDTPSLVSMPGVLACVVTLNPNAGEGQSPDEHVAIVRSTDNGVTWGSAIAVEPMASPVSAWGMPWYDADNDLLYVFYTYNYENLSSVPHTTSGSSSRVDCVGAVAYRTSSDKGLTWSDRTLLQVPLSTIDSRNGFSGVRPIFWLYDTPKFRNGKVYFGLSKTTDMRFVDTEAFIGRVTLPAPEELELLPGTNGLRALTTFGASTIGEECTPVIHADGVITAYARTDRGRMIEAVSTDDGQTFTIDWMRLSDGVGYVYSGRAPAAVWELPDGRFLLWHYNRATSEMSEVRDPVYYRIGTRFENRIRWGSARLLTQSSTRNRQIGYASMAIVGSELLIAASDKGTAHGGAGAKLLRFNLSDF